MNRTLTGVTQLHWCKYFIGLGQEGKRFDVPFITRFGIYLPSCLFILKCLYMKQTVYFVFPRTHRYKMKQFSTGKNFHNPYQLLKKYDIVLLLLVYVIISLSVRNKLLPVCHQHFVIHWKVTWLLAWLYWNKENYQLKIAIPTGSKTQFWLWGCSFKPHLSNWF